MSQRLYTAAIYLMLPFGLFLLLRKRTNKPHVGSRWKEYFGYIKAEPNWQNTIWVHAVSVGEVIAAKPLLVKLQQKHPQSTILVTTTTTTGAEQVRKIAGNIAHRYMPLDVPCFVERFLKTVKPHKLIIMETELWPNTLHLVGKAKIPTYVVNARLSEKSMRNYQRFGALFRSMIPNVTKILCQYPSDLERFKQLGVEPHKLHVTGSIKYDITIGIEVIELAEKTRAILGEERPVWIAASTHQGEDEIVINAHKAILKRYPTALLIIVPRHPERFDRVHQLLLESGMTTVRRTSSEIVTSNTQVYLGDSMGEMLTLIGASDICFMGGSLLGGKVGGHNFIEPAALQKPILSGSSYYNFSEVAESLLNNEALYIENSVENIAQRVINLIEDIDKRHQVALNAYGVFQKSTGSLGKTIQLL
ncbi:lipid IV(A) 3-deoxy-D-manno-octulosonic acid transferase [Vibrio sinaloensis]|uniref:lipid IV(A) 3-deoxy-D-manno-octulosonic acid transferase n=1 Tax=Photobacterium sp. (strain ATCC 43367) TaxID=379097 RepID=UPI0022B076D2|nr:lipid IV(A) 3-deoxy-D-manno-octulosonic acid transferase [Vibrio sinaloensis]MCZ4294789.1 lipid IV(A) 3-deoxy-D-manno-octulosonic acid transferase [Vibrio sinaloensis]